MLDAPNRAPAEAQLLLLEVTVFACRDIATLPTPDCELDLLRQRLQEELGPGADVQRWREAGVAIDQLGKQHCKHMQGRNGIESRYCEAAQP